ncbi:F0F1 ATP synthase subunit B [Skermanella rosea]|uniref:ATP synthase subunit b n=1 Tax=Skermanella cutis TaxID=2775420 RepID=A0ABX7B832_9PROT|nr:MULTISPECIES: F0F1 ATP synthase subunit B [Skermanella]QQP90342.1 F0F1 ATP synthase subunit B [Skermanella sp. TT6]UEM04507.1 F0F1 ATP synthase subunit B [Skermanella rosea]
MFQAAEFWVAVAFFIFLFFAFRPGAKALTAMLDDRADKIRQELEEAQRLREDAQATLASYQRRQRDALKEAEDIIAHAREEAERLRLHAAADLDSSMKRREAQAMDKIAQAEALALQEVKSLTVDLAIAASGRLIAENMDAAQSAKLVDAAIADLPRNLH